MALEKEVNWIILFCVVAACWLWEWLFPLTSKDRGLTLSDAGALSIFYVIVALLFSLFIVAVRGPGDASLFLSAYFMEKSLSVDNLVAFGAVFAYFDIRPQYRHKILHYGLLGAVVLRLVFVLVGTVAFYLASKAASLIFAAFILWSVYAMLTAGGNTEAVDHRGRWYTRWLGKIWPIYSLGFHEGAFFKDLVTARGPRRAATPVLLCLIAIEVTDVMFAFDSVPTVIAVARDPFLVFSAMIFAVMGLRALYFVVEALQRAFAYTIYAVALILVYVAVKLVGDAFGLFDFPPVLNLVVVAALLGAGVTASLFFTHAEDKRVMAVLGEMRSGMKEGHYHCALCLMPFKTRELKWMHMEMAHGYTTLEVKRDE